MLLIWGWRTRASVLAQGTFLCPDCCADRGYEHKQMRRWFTLFFIPVIPLKRLGEFVECTTCGGTYKTAVLDMPTTATVEREMLVALRDALVLVLRAGDTPAARAAAAMAHQSFAGETWSDEELDADVASRNIDDLDGRLATLATTLNEQGKERFLAACAEVAATGGVIDASCRAELRSIGAGLTMTPAHTRGVISEVLQAARA